MEGQLVALHGRVEDEGSAEHSDTERLTSSLEVEPPLARPKALDHQAFVCLRPNKQPEDLTQPTSSLRAEPPQHHTDF